MAAVEGSAVGGGGAAAAAAGGRRRLGERGRLCGAEEEGTGCSDADGEVVVEEAERRCRSVDVAVPAVEGAVGEQAAPGLADEGGTRCRRDLISKSAIFCEFHIRDDNGGACYLVH